MQVKTRHKYSKFDRWGLWSGVSWALRRFKEHHTELNQLYWSYVPLREIGRFKTKSLSPDDSANEALHVDENHEDARRVPNPVSKWREENSDFDNWVRLNALMAASSYFELYLSSVVKAALQSKPGILLGHPGMADGAELLCRDVRMDTDSILRDCTMGQWPSRYAALKRLFGPFSSDFTERIGGLDKLRQIRNGVGHAFGREIDDPAAMSVADPLEMVRVSESGLKTWLSLIMESAQAIDDHIASNYVGEYETLRHYHRWRVRVRESQGKVAADWTHSAYRAYSKELGEIFGRTPGIQFCRELDQYYQTHVVT